MVSRSHAHCKKIVASAHKLRYGRAMDTRQQLRNLGPVADTAAVLGVDRTTLTHALEGRRGLAPRACVAVADLLGADLAVVAREVGNGLARLVVDISEAGDLRSAMEVA